MKTSKIKKINNRKFIFLSLVFVLFSLSIIFLFPNKNKKGNQNYSASREVTQQNCLSDDCLLIDNLNYPVDTLTPEIQSALDQALEDEYKAYVTYSAVIKRFGNIKPFSMIIRAEEQHISSLKSIYDKYGATIPENKLKIEDINLPSTIKEVCQIGVDAEVANASLYLDKLLPLVKKYPDITSVFEKLMNASKQNHLPAFQKCI